MRIERLVLGELDTNCWVVGDDEGGPVIVIDPAGSPQHVLDAVGDRGVEAIALTHGHFDHIGAVTELVERTGAPLLVHADDAVAVTSPMMSGGMPFGMARSTPKPDRELRQGDVVVAGDVSLDVLHTPGHTPGCICLLGEGHLFSGDTLFAGSVGRTDFPGGDARTLRRSIAERLAPLPDDVRVHPGHGPDTTIGRERRINPFFPRA